MTDAERTLLLLVAAAVRADLLSPWNYKPHDALARAESIADLAEKVQEEANQTETTTT